MPRTTKELLIESCAKAVCVFAISHPIGACCGLVLSALLETAPAEKLIELLGEELAKAVGIRVTDALTEIEPGSLPEAFLLALSHAIGKVRREHRKEIEANGWEKWFANWSAALKRVRRHRWKDMSALARAIGTLNKAPEDWAFLRETLVLLDWSARLAGASDANRTEMPDELAAWLEAHLGEAFLEELKELLAGRDFGLAHVDLTFEIASLAVAAATPLPGISHRLTGADDARLRPMRGFFTGRAQQVQAVTEFLAGAAKLGVVTGQIYSVQGGPGIGETELCKAALRTYLRQHPESRAYHIDVTGVRSVDGLRAALAGALGNPRLAEDPLALLGELKAQTDIIYLDNLEDALSEVDNAGADVFGWLEAMVEHDLKVLASSRRRLGTLAQEFPLGRLSAGEAKELFEHFWRGEPIGEPERFGQFIERDLDCHALTIRLLAAQGAEWRRWQDLRAAWLKFRTRLAEDAGRRDRLSSLDVSISLTFDQVRTKTAAAELWIAFACFPEGMSAVAQRAIVPDEAAGREAVEQLRTLGVVYRPDGGGREGRLEMLAPLRQFAAGQADGVTLAVWERCLRFFAAVAGWAASTEPGGGGHRRPALQMLSAEFGNLREGMFLAMERGYCGELVQQIHYEMLNSYQFYVVASVELLQRLDAFFLTGGWTLSRASTLKLLGDVDRRLGDAGRARQHYEEALQLYESQQVNQGRGNALRALGELELALGDLSGAGRRYEEALRLFEAVRDDLGRANTLQSLGDLEGRLGDVAGARRRYEAALRLYASEGAKLGRAGTLKALGDLEIRMGDVAGARRRFDEALELYGAERADLGRAHTLLSLGALQNQLGDVAGARERYDEALQLYASEQYNLGRANTLQLLGDLEKRLGDLAGARQSYREALQIFEAEKSNLGRANLLQALGDLERRLGDVAGARQRYEEALQLFQAERANLGRANTLLSLGDLQRRTGDVAGARQRYEEALQLYASEQANQGRANALQSLGDLEREQGNAGAARQRYEEALQIFEAEQANLGRANTLKSLGDLERWQGDAAGAGKRYEAALRLYEAEQDRLGRANTLRSLGELERGRGDRAKARQRYREALDLYAAEQANLGRANTLLLLGDLEMEVNPGEGEKLLAEAVGLFEAEQAPVGIAQARMRLAILYQFLGRAGAAAEAAGLARAAARNSGIGPIIEQVEQVLAGRGI